MPVANIAEARDFVNQVIDDAWTSAAEPAGWLTPGVGWPPDMFWADVSGDLPQDKPYATVNIVHQRGGQVAIGDSGNRRFRAWAVVTVALYTPSGDGLTLSDYLVNIIQDAFEAHHTPDKVYFRDVRVVDDAQDGVNNKVRVLANLDYDRVK